MGEVYTFTPRFPQAYCHLCNQHYKQIFAHIRGKEHKKRYKEYLQKKRYEKLGVENPRWYLSDYFTKRSANK